MRRILGWLGLILLGSAAWGSSRAAERCFLEGPLWQRPLPEGAELGWRTSAEFGVVGFELLAPGGRLLYPEIIGASNQPAGASYRLPLPSAVLPETVTLRVWAEDGTARDHVFRPEGWNEATGRKPAGEPVVVAPPGRRSAAPLAGLVDTVDVATSRDGVHFLAFSALATALQIPEAEVAQRAAAGTLGFRQDGRLVPVWVPAGSAGCYFHARRGESLYFAGNVTQVRLESGVLLPTQAVPPQTDPARRGARSRVEVTRKVQAIVTLPGAAEDDFWVWDSFLGGSTSLGNRSYAFDLPGVEPDGESAVVAMDLATTSLASHDFALTLNGQRLGNESWVGAQRRRLTFPVAASVLRGSSNVLQIASVGDRLSLGYLYGFSVEYTRRLDVAGGAMIFWSPTEAVLEVRGTPGVPVETWDVTDPVQPVRLQPGTGPVDHLVFRALPGRVYAGFHPGTVPTPDRLTPFGPPTLADPASSAEYVLVAPDGWTTAAASLAQRRAAQGLQSRVVPLSSIHHEFGAGKSTPLALVEFLRQAAARWNPKPRFVVLVGDGTYDYQSHLARNDNLVPPLVGGTLFGRITTDVLFGDFDRDGRPEVAVGRLPVRNETEWQRMLGQIDTFESRAVVAPRALVLADKPDQGGDFIANAEDLSNSLAAGFAVEEVYNPTGDVAGTRTNLLQQLSAGVNVLNYVGHGARDRFGNTYLASADVASTSFGEEQPLVVAMTCSAGQFGVPGFPCLAETLVLKSGRAPAAVWSASGYSLDFQTHLLNRIFTDQLVQQTRGSRLGEIVRSSLTAFRDAGGDSISPMLYNLMGDPALALNFGTAEIRLQARSAPTGLQLTLTGAPNRQYRVEASDGLRSDGATVWTVRRSVSTGPSGTVEWVEPVDPLARAEFFRVVAAP